MKNKKYVFSKFFCNKLISQTEQKERKIELFQIIMGDRLFLTPSDLDKRQKLLDFISDKDKLSLKSFFDHKGSKDFLNGKDEAMQKIELNDSIEENIKEKNSPKNNKKIMYQLSVDLVYNNSIDMITKEDTIKKNKCKKYKSITTKFLNKCPKNQFNKIKEKFKNIELEWVPHSPTNKHKKRKLIENKKTKKSKKEKKNSDISISSITTVDSKLFNDNMEYEIYKDFISNDVDDTLIEEIIFELDVNKK